MKTRKEILIVAISLLIPVLFLAGCMDNSGLYSKVPESLYIQNGTESTIYVEYNFLKSTNVYQRNIKDSVPKSMSSFYYFDDSQITGLWISEKDFNKYVSKIRIYQLIKGDSIFVAPQYYNTKSAWNYEFYQPGYLESGIKENRNELTILPQMFNK